MRAHLLFVTALLAVIGFSIFGYKVGSLQLPLLPDESSHFWLIEAHLSFTGKNRPVKATLNIPRSSNNFLIMDESFISRGFGLATKTRGPNRSAVWSIRRASGQQGLYYRAVVRKGSGQLVAAKEKAPDKPDKPQFEGLRKEAAEALLTDVEERSADTESLVIRLIKVLADSEDNQNASALLGKKPTRLRRGEVAVQLLAALGIPARIVHGLPLDVATRNAEFDEILEVWDKDDWKSFDLHRGDVGQSLDLLPWWYGEQPLSYVHEADRVESTVSIDRIQEDTMNAALAGARVTRPALIEYSLFSLPVETQTVYRILLLIPLGALIVVILRNIIGLKTFGTFMPILIALAFRETELIYGIFLFVILIFLGLAARFYLDHLKLLLVPRLGAVLTVVVLLMAALSLLTHKLGIERGLSVALFPMVIVTMTIERMSIVWDELGALEAIKHCIGSLGAAAIIYVSISNELVRHLVFVFPELLLVNLAIILLLGRYRGYRLVELYRFREFARENG